MPLPWFTGVCVCVCLCEFAPIYVKCVSLFVIHSSVSELKLNKARGGGVKENNEIKKRKRKGKKRYMEELSKRIT